MKVNFVPPRPPEQVPRKQVIMDMADLIRKMPLESEDIRVLYTAITNRMTHKTCCKCGKLKLETEGELIWLDGDMSKPKRFVCGDCK